MKINWGVKIIIAFVSFISFIMYMVVSMNINQKYDHDLVTENYYKKELQFQEEINKELNYKNLAQVIEIVQTSRGLLLKFPSLFEPEHLTGKVFLYRPSDKQFDFETPISLSNNYLLIPDNRLLDGRWNITIDWNYKGTYYLFKEKINY